MKNKRIPNLSVQEEQMKSILNALVLVALGMASMAVLTGDGITQAQSPRYINVPDRSDDLPYSNAVLVGDTLYLAGSIGIDPETGAPPEKIEDEVRIVMDSMKQRLEMVGMTMDDLVTVRVFCPDLSLYDEFNAIYRTYFKEHFPARAFIGSGPLLLGGHFEVTGMAVKQ
jgi:enamine deaminase RidA (YjgF/YER057c/UK114 family)